MASSLLSMLQATAAPWITEIPLFSLEAVKPIVIAATPTTTPTTLPDLPTPTLSAVQHTLSVFQHTQGDCAPQPAAYGPIPKYDNVRGFYHSKEIQDVAEKAETPPGYIQSFESAKGSYVGAKYLGHYELSSFDTLACARRCDEYEKMVKPLSTGTDANSGLQTTAQNDAANKSNEDEQNQICKGFNVYFERSPTIHLGPKCRDAPSRTIIKCALWGEPLHIEKATNTGYKEWDFDVAIAGSNGYHLQKGGSSGGVGGGVGGIGGGGRGGRGRGAASGMKGMVMSKMGLLGVFVGQVVLGALVL